MDMCLKWLHWEMNFKKNVDTSNIKRFLGWVSAPWGMVSHQIHPSSGSLTMFNSRSCNTLPFSAPSPFRCGPSPTKIGRLQLGRSWFSSRNFRAINLREENESWFSHHFVQPSAPIDDVPTMAAQVCTARPVRRSCWNTCDPPSRCWARQPAEGFWWWLGQVRGWQQKNWLKDV